MLRICLGNLLEGHQKALYLIIVYYIYFNFLLVMLKSELYIFSLLLRISIFETRLRHGLNENFIYEMGEAVFRLLCTFLNLMHFIWF